MTCFCCFGPQTSCAWGLLGALNSGIAHGKALGTICNGGSKLAWPHANGTLFSLASHIWHLKAVNNVHRNGRIKNRIIQRKVKDNRQDNSIMVLTPIFLRLMRKGFQLHLVCQPYHDSGCGSGILATSPTLANVRAARLLTHLEDKSRMIGLSTTSSKHEKPAFIYHEDIHLQSVKMPNWTCQNFIFTLRTLQIYPLHMCKESHGRTYVKCFFNI